MKSRLYETHADQMLASVPGKPIEKEAVASAKIVESVSFDHGSATPQGHESVPRLPLVDRPAFLL